MSGLRLRGRLPGTILLQTIVVLERNGRFGQETSSRNSEVIHAGMYYPTGSLKARLCVEGNRLLYDYCRTHGIAHEQTGKLIVARDDAEAATLETILAQGRENSVPGLSLLSAGDVRRIEPDVQACAALFSETTGVVDSHQLMASLEASAAKRGVVFAYGHRVETIEPGARRLPDRLLHRASAREQGIVVPGILSTAPGLAASRLQPLWA